MKINILSPGRFHALDLARELDKNGYDVKFYSYVPTSRVKVFGLPNRCNVSFLWILLPFLALNKLTNTSAWSIALRSWIQDFVTRCFMRRCDVLISMSGCFPMTNRYAKGKGSVVIIERGSKHILEQRLILESIPSLAGTKPVPDLDVKKELIDYELADYISVASSHVKESFLKYGYPEEKIFVNPYGVDLSMFKPLFSVKKIYDFIFVGQWSYQKGCDLLTEAIKKTEYTLLHVGTIGDLPFPVNNQFIHVDKVNQKDLLNYYNQAYCFVLPSRQEGLALVQAQAISCNLPVLGTVDTGINDLKKYVDEPEYIAVVNPLNVDNLVKEMKSLRDKANLTKNNLYAGVGISKLTWDEYGKRYSDFLSFISCNNICSNNVK